MASLLETDNLAGILNPIDIKIQSNNEVSEIVLGLSSFLSCACLYIGIKILAKLPTTNNTFVKVHN